MVDTVSVKRWPEGQMATLQARKQLLQEQLAARNEELRRLCIQEAELTGTMPPEVPLEPGESPPPFRRLVGTGYAYPQNLINKLKTNEVESIAALELEKQVQAGISEAALGLVHNGAASKAVRRKNRLVYQQSQRRLSELEERLGYLMASRNSTEPTSGHYPQSPLPTHHAHNSNSHSSHAKLPIHQHSSPQPSPQHQTPPQYSHPIPRQSQSPQRTLSNQHSHQHQHQHQHQPPLHHHNTKYKKKPRPATIDVDREHRNHDDNRSSHYSTLSGNSSHSCMLPPPHERLERTVSAIHPRQQVQLAPHQQYDTGLGGYWMCLDTGETVWCSVEPNYWQRETRFGSLDRPKVRPLQHKWSAPTTLDADDGHRHVSHHSSIHLKTPPDISKHQRLQSPQEMYNIMEGGKLSESWHNIMQAHSLGNVASQSTVDSSSCYRERTGSRKYKQKKWYETSLDSPQQESPGSTHSHHTGSLESMLPPHSPYHQSPLATPTKSPQHRNHTPPIVPSTPPPILQTLPPIAPPTPPTRVPPLELPPETIPAPSSPFNNNNTVQVQSPKNCTVIQPGQWKPYREVTKPFEMSDFYKYSTKFRNRSSTEEKQVDQRSLHNGEETFKSGARSTTSNSEDPAENGVDTTDSSSTLYHKGIYQPLQPMKCQPFHHTNSVNSNHSSTSVGSNSSHEMKRNVYSPSHMASDQTSHQPINALGTMPTQHGYNNVPSTVKNNAMTTSTLV